MWRRVRRRRRRRRRRRPEPREQGLVEGGGFARRSRRQDVLVERVRRWRRWRRRRRIRRRGRRRQRREEDLLKEGLRLFLPVRGKRSVQVVRGRRVRDASGREERRETSREVEWLIGGGRDLCVQRARRRRGYRVPRLPRVVALVSEQERRELGLEGRGDARLAETRVVVEVRRVVRRRDPHHDARQREGRQRDARAPHVPRRAFAPPRAPEESRSPDDVRGSNRTKSCQRQKNEGERFRLSRPARALLPPPSPRTSSR